MKRGRDVGLESTAQRPRVRCTLAAEAREFVQTLGIDDAFFAPEHDRCYCATCARHLPTAIQVAANHTYELPKGFYGFGIQTPPRARSLQIFEKWAVTYHGIKASNVASVLNEGGLLLPGDTLLDGTTLKAAHTRDDDRQRLYTSPSVLYSEMAVYTEPIHFRGSNAKIVLQCRQLPDFEICGETIGWERKNPGKRISPSFANSEIERYTLRRNAIIPYRILVKLEAPRFEVKWPGLPSTALVKQDEIAKCRSSEFYSEDDVVQATAQVRSSAGTVAKGALGRFIMVTGEELMVNWHGTIGNVNTPRGSIRKCEPREFWLPGDVVKSTCELDYGKEAVAKNTLGTLKTALDAKGEHVVTWPFGEGKVKPSQIRKADRCEFWSCGDVCRALEDLDYGGSSNGGVARMARLIKEGSIGIFTDLKGDPVTVDWSPHPLGKAKAYRATVMKCEPMEHLTIGDVVRATRELSFMYDDGKKTIHMGDIGTLIGIDSDSA